MTTKCEILEEETNKKMTISDPLVATQHSGIICFLLSCLSDAIICCGIALGFYTRWVYFNYTIILALGVFGLFVVALNLALRYYFAFRVFDPLVHIWLSTALCLVGLWDSPNLSTHKQLEDLMNILFVAGLLCRVLVDVFFIFCKNQTKPSTKNVLTSRDTFQIMGFYVSCIVSGSNLGSLFCIVTALGVNLFTLKLKSFFTFVNVAFLCGVTEWYLLPNLNISINPYAIICAVGRLYCSAVLELFLISFTRLDRWSSIITSRKFILRCMAFVFIIIEICFFVVHASAIKNHKEWYVVVPFFVIASIYWTLTHVLSFVIVCTLSNKFGKCRESFGGEIFDTLTMKKVLAAHGLRYFSLIAQKLMFATIFGTVIITALCWTTPTAYSHALTSIVLALEICICELLHEFTYNLGGTCVGYAVVAPVALLRTDGLVNVLPPTFIQEVGLRSTQIVNCIVQFFTQHMITNFGCDWSTSGVDWADLQKKLGNFFSHTTVEGPRYDSYVLYYSGPVTGKGDWALTGNHVVSLDNIVELWNEHQIANDGGGGASRLVIICDCEHSSVWLKPVKKLSNGYLALQTFCFAKKVDPESVTTIGDFTRLWVDYNASNNRNVFENACLVRPVYAVSKLWTDFHFHFPTSYDIRNYWQNYLPRFTHAFLGVIIRLVTARIPIFACCDCCSRLFKRWRLRVWPPVEFDTGHGFKLLRL